MQKCLLILPLVVISASGREPAVTLLRVPNAGLQPQVTVAADGAINLLYFSGDPKSGNLFLVRSKDGGKTFSLPLRVNSQGGSAIAMGTIRGGQMAAGAGGRVHVAWNGSGTASPPGPISPGSGKHGMPMLYSRLNDEGIAFEPQRNLMQKTFDLDGGGTVAADRNGNVFVGWHGNKSGAGEGEAGRQVWVAASRDGGKTFGVEAPAWKEPTGACGCCGMSLFAANGGTLLALYRSAARNVHRDIYLLASKDRGMSFQGSLVQRWEINACPMSSMSFAEGAGAALAAWETGGQVFYGKVSGGKVGQPVAAPGDAKGRKHPRIATNSRGETILVWTESTGWQRGGTLAWQVFGPTGKPIGEMGTAPGVAAWSFGAAGAHPDGGFFIVY